MAGTGAAVGSTLAAITVPCDESPVMSCHIRQTDTQTDRQTDGQRGRQTDRQADREAERQTDRQTDRQRR